MNITSELKKTRNLFFAREPSVTEYARSSYSSNPARVLLSRKNERSIVNSILTKIALDAASVDIKHVDTDEDGRLKNVRKSSFNECLTLSANLDQISRDFFADVYLSMMDEGVVAVVPYEYSGEDPRTSDSYDIESLRTAKILSWYPKHVKVRIYNDLTGNYEERIVPKHCTAIIPNPLATVMNEPNSTLQRLIKTLNQLDVIGEQTAAGKLDLIISLPYAARSENRKNQADKRRREIEDQLNGSKYGIAWIDGTEHITQLNRPVVNNLLSQAEYLTKELYSQLGINTEIMDGTADENVMNNYYNRTIEPFLSYVVLEFKRKFLSKTARTEGQSIMFFRDPFRLMPISLVAEIADKFTRNEILTPNEVRQKLGMRPAKDPKADELSNRNISQSKQEIQERANKQESITQETQENQNGHGNSR